MSDQKPSSPDLSSFADDYEIVGERASPDSSRIFLANRKSDDARRRDDRTGVLITVYSTPEGDEANALTQYAADTGTLIGLTHRRLVPVLDGRWVGDDAFAVVTQRVNDPTLAQRLEQHEEFHSTRIAAILREVNGLLEWAREQKIVHRRVTPDQIYLEPNTDRVRVNFAIAPIQRLKQPGPHDDARTIARLAIAMLGGDPDIQACDQGMLMDLRPNLPQSFCDATAQLLDPRDLAGAEDVAAYIGMIGMADPLVEGETERDRIRAEIIEEQRVERERLAAERTEFDRKVAEERAAFEAEIAAERAAFEKAKAEERARVEQERLELQKAVTKERAELQKALAAERAALLARRNELEKQVADQRLELERTAAKDRADIERLRAALKAAGDQEIEQKRLAALEDITGDEESVLDHEDLATPRFGMPVLPAIEPISFDEESPVLSKEKIVFAAAPIPEPEPVAAAASVRRPAGAPATTGFWASRRNQLIAAGVAGLIVIGGASAIIAGNQGPDQVTARPVAAARPRIANTSNGQAAPAVPLPASPAPATVAAPVVVDSATAMAWMDSLRNASPVNVDAEVARAERERLAQAAAAQAAAQRKAEAERQAAADREAAAKGVRVSREILSQPGGVRAPRPARAGQRDTAPRLDTVALPDSVPVPPVPPA